LANQRANLGIAALLVLTAAGMLPFANAPWAHRDDYASAAYALVARNHVEFGLAATRGASVLNVDRTAPAESPIYAHHPFLWPLVEAAAFRLFGASELVTRLVCIATAAATIWLLFRLLREQFSPRVGFFAAALFAVSPANLFTGRTNSLEQPANLLVVASVLAYTRWRAQRSGGRLLWLLAVLAVGMQIEWQIYYLAAILPVHAVLSGRQRDDWLAGAAMVATALAMFALFLGHLWLADAAQFADLKNAFLFRSGLMSAPRQLSFAGTVTQFGAGEYIETLLRHAAHLMTVPFLLVATAGLLYCAAGMRNARDRLPLATPLLLIAPALLHSAIFSNAMFVHECMVILYLPGLASAAAVASDRFLAATIATNQAGRTARDRQQVAARRGLAALGGWRLVGVMLFVVVYSMLSLRRTAELYSHPNFDALIAGVEIGDVAGPHDSVLVLGIPYHPAVEWYAKRDVQFADRSPTGAARPDRAPTMVAVLDHVDDWLAAASQQAGDDFARQTRHLLLLVKQAKSRQKTDHLTLYRLSPSE
jgi:4-amino-4-deoxy-L-arabinose transferase-like glycosyltransferase